MCLASLEIDFLNWEMYLSNWEMHLSDLEICLTNLEISRSAPQIYVSSLYFQDANQENKRQPLYTKAAAFY